MSSESLEKSLRYTVTAARHTEHLVAKELGVLGAQNLSILKGAVEFDGTLKTAYAACLWCRTALHVLFPIARFTIRDDHDLYQQVKAIDWNAHLSCHQTLAVDFTAINGVISHQQFGAQRVKDAIVDFFRDQDGARPDVDPAQPDVQISLFLRDSEATLSIDLSGQSLHRRGYRHHSGPAPLKENLAAALLLRAGWYEIARKGGALIDPLCGSGTLLIEGLMIAADIAPNLYRTYFGFLGWKQHDPELWQALVEEALERRRIGLLKAPTLIGCDRDGAALKLAQRALNFLGLESAVTLTSSELAELAWPEALTPYSRGLIITNPPYGERLGNEQDVLLTHQWLGQFFRRAPESWTPVLFTHRPDLANIYGYQIAYRYPFMNGPLECRLIRYERATETVDTADPASVSASVSPPDIPPDLLNRLKKNRQKLKKWIQQNQIECYRLYDADLPDYAAAIDCYQDWVHIQEYAPPKTIDRTKSEFRKMQLINAVSHILDCPLSHIVVKTRAKQKGTQQYVRLDDQRHALTVTENQLKFKVNLQDYLDTGLFLDHRLTRKRIFSAAKNKHFLNLFCYTGAATLYAAAGGALSTTSVDLSQTYLEWCRDNLSLNRLLSRSHQLIQADCLTWLTNCSQRFDLIFLDPPTFSNSKRMDETLDIQRDHVPLISDAMSLLNPGGELIFSTNRKKFSLDPDLSKRYAIQDITTLTTDLDFKRRPLHQCWIFKHL
jgi:23S rRNA (guanine2445-N2)-methyltransferase / 23S rRNA (guanine2069-N7)-methyltransferase